jgi:hypothetical protein
MVSFCSVAENILLCRREKVARHKVTDEKAVRDEGANNTRCRQQQAQTGRKYASELLYQSTLWLYWVSNHRRCVGRLRSVKHRWRSSDVVQDISRLIENKDFVLLREVALRAADVSLANAGWRS